MNNIDFDEIQAATEALSNPDIFNDNVELSNHGVNIRSDIYDGNVDFSNKNIFSENKRYLTNCEIDQNESIVVSLPHSQESTKHSEYNSVYNDINLASPANSNSSFQYSVSKKFLCPICEFVFKSKTDFIEHVNTHNDESKDSTPSFHEAAETFTYSLDTNTLLEESKEGNTFDSSPFKTRELTINSSQEINISDPKAVSSFVKNEVYLSDNSINDSAYDRNSATEDNDSKENSTLEESNIDQTNEGPSSICHGEKCSNDLNESAIDDECSDTENEEVSSTSSTTQDIGPLACNICHQVFLTSEDLTQHQYSHNDPDIHSCSLCDAAFIGSHLLLAHMQRDHQIEDQEFIANNEPILICHLCQEKFLTERKFLEHVSYHSDKFIANRLSPANSESLQSQYISSTTSANNIINYECKKCSQMFISEYEIKHHITQYHKEVNECSKCHFLFEYRSEFEQHLHTHNHQRDIICEICKLILPNVDCLKRHCREIHTGFNINLNHDPTKYMQCKICFEKFSDPISITQHTAYHFQDSDQNIAGDVDPESLIYVRSSSHHMRKMDRKNYYINRSNQNVCRLRARSSNYFQANCIVRLSDFSRPDTTVTVCVYCEMLIEKHKLKNHVKRHIKSLYKMKPATNGVKTVEEKITKVTSQLNGETKFQASSTSGKIKNEVGKGKFVKNRSLSESSNNYASGGKGKGTSVSTSGKNKCIQSQCGKTSSSGGKGKSSYLNEDKCATASGKIRNFPLQLDTEVKKEEGDESVTISSSEMIENVIETNLLPEKLILQKKKFAKSEKVKKILKSAKVVKTKTKCNEKKTALKKLRGATNKRSGIDRKRLKKLDKLYERINKSRNFLEGSNGKKGKIKPSDEQQRQNKSAVKLDDNQTTVADKLTDVTSKLLDIVMLTKEVQLSESKKEKLENQRKEKERGAKNTESSTKKITIGKDRNESKRIRTNQATKKAKDINRTGIVEKSSKSTKGKSKSETDIKEEITELVKKNKKIETVQEANIAANLNDKSSYNVNTDHNNQSLKTDQKKQSSKISKEANIAGTNKAKEGDFKTNKDETKLISPKEPRELLTKETGDDLSNEVGRNQKRKGILVSRVSQRYSSNTDKNKNSMSQTVIEKSLDGSIRTESTSKQPCIEPKQKRGRPRIVKNMSSYSAATKDVTVNHILKNNPKGVSKEVSQIARSRLRRSIEIAPAVNREEFSNGKPEEMVSQLRQKCRMLNQKSLPDIKMSTMHDRSNISHGFQGTYTGTVTMGQNKILPTDNSRNSNFGTNNEFDYYYNVRLGNPVIKISPLKTNSLRSEKVSKSGCMSIVKLEGHASEPPKRVEIEQPGKVAELKGKVEVNAVTQRQTGQKDDLPKSATENGGRNPELHFTDINRRILRHESANERVRARCRKLRMNPSPLNLRRMVKSNSKRFCHSRKMNLYAYNRSSNKHLQRSIQEKLFQLENGEDSFTDNATVKSLKKYSENDRVNQEKTLVNKKEKDSSEKGFLDINRRILRYESVSEKVRMRYRRFRRNPLSINLRRMTKNKTKRLAHSRKMNIFAHSRYTKMKRMVENMNQSNSNRFSEQASSLESREADKQEAQALDGCWTGHGSEILTCNENLKTVNKVTANTNEKACVKSKQGLEDELSMPYKKIEENLSLGQKDIDINRRILRHESSNEKLRARFRKLRRNPMSIQLRKTKRKSIIRVDAASIRSFDSDFTQNSLQLIVKSQMESQGNRSLSPEKLSQKVRPSVSQRQLQRKRSCSPQKQPQKEILNPKKEVSKEDRLSPFERSIQTFAVSRKSLGSQKLTRNMISRIHSVKGRYSSSEVSGLSHPAEVGRSSSHFLNLYNENHDTDEETANNDFIRRSPRKVRLTIKMQELKKKYANLQIKRVNTTAIHKSIRYEKLGLVQDIGKRDTHLNRQEIVSEGYIQQKNGEGNEETSINTTTKQGHVRIKNCKVKLEKLKVADLQRLVPFRPANYDVELNDRDNYKAINEEVLAKKNDTATSTVTCTMSNVPCDLFPATGYVHMGNDDEKTPQEKHTSSTNLTKDSLLHARLLRRHLSDKGQSSETQQELTSFSVVADDFENASNDKVCNTNEAGNNANGNNEFFEANCDSYASETTENTSTNFTESFLRDDKNQCRTM